MKSIQTMMALFFGACTDDTQETPEKNVHAPRMTIGISGLEKKKNHVLGSW